MDNKLSLNFPIVIKDYPAAAAGFSLIEVLISLLLLSLMLLGLDIMGVYVFQKNRDTWFMVMAVNQITSMMERIHVSINDEELKEHVSQWNLQNKQLHMQGRVKKLTSSYIITLCRDDLNNKASCLQETISP